MRSAFALLLVLALACPAFAAVATTWNNVYLMDETCAPNMKTGAEKHTAGCLEHCGRNSSVGIVTADGKYLKFDKAGQATALEALKKSGKKTGLKVKVSGEVSGDVITLKSISFQ